MICPVPPDEDEHLKWFLAGVFVVCITGNIIVSSSCVRLDVPVHLR